MCLPGIWKDPNITHIWKLSRDLSREHISTTYVNSMLEHFLQRNICQYKQTQWYPSILIPEQFMFLHHSSHFVIFFFLHQLTSPSSPNHDSQHTKWNPGAIDLPVRYRWRAPLNMDGIVASKMATNSSSSSVTPTSRYLFSRLLLACSKAQRLPGFLCDGKIGPWEERRKCREELQGWTKASADVKGRWTALRT